MSESSSDSRGIYAPFSRATIRRQLSEMLPHDRAWAERRLGWLLEFFREDRIRGGLSRCATRAAVAERLTRLNPGHAVSAKTLGRLETAYRKHGATGLVGRRGRCSEKSSGIDLTALDKLQIPEALKLLSGVLVRLSKRCGQ